MQGFEPAIDDVEDLRASNSTLHVHRAVQETALPRMICGARSCTAMEPFWRSQERRLGSFKRIDHGVSCRDAVSTLFRVLGPECRKWALLRPAADWSGGIAPRDLRRADAGAMLSRVCCSRRISAPCPNRDRVPGSGAQADGMSSAA